MGGGRCRYDSDAWTNGEGCVAEDDTGVCGLMKACAATWWLAMVGRCAGLERDIDELLNEGNGVRSYGGGGGSPSDALGELELFRTSVFRDGENIGRCGKTELTEPCPHGCCGVVLVPAENEGIPDGPDGQ